MYFCLVVGCCPCLAVAASWQQRQVFQCSTPFYVCLGTLLLFLLLFYEPMSLLLSVRVAIAVVMAHEHISLRRGSRNLTHLLIGDSLDLKSVVLLCSVLMLKGRLELEIWLCAGFIWVRCEVSSNGWNCTLQFLSSCIVLNILQLVTLPTKRSSISALLGLCYKVKKRTPCTETVCVCDLVSVTKLFVRFSWNSVLYKHLLSRHEFQENLPSDLGAWLDLCQCIPYFGWFGGIQHSRSLINSV